MTEIQIHLILPWAYCVAPGFIPAFLWKILSLIKCVPSAGQEGVCNGNSFPWSRAAPGKSGRLKSSQRVYGEERVAQPPRPFNYGCAGDAEIYFVDGMARSAVQIIRVNTKAEEGISVLDQFYRCCESCAWLGVFESSLEFSYGDRYFYLHLASLSAFTQC